MGGFKRFCLIVFALAGIACLCALVLPWVGPYQEEAIALMDNDYYYIGVQVVAAITALGVVLVLLRALFTPRKRKTVVVSKSGGDQISVTTAAISSQAIHVVEEQGTLIAEKVHVSTNKGSKVKVDVRVRPRQTVDISAEGQRLHDDLARGLSTICGDRVQRINLEFVEAEEPVPAQNVLVERIDDNPPAAMPEAQTIPEIPASVYERAQLMEQESAGADITVPMGSASTKEQGDAAADKAPEADEAKEAASEGEEA